MSREKARRLYVADYKLFEALTPEIKKSPYARDYFHVLRNDLMVIQSCVDFPDRWDKYHQHAIPRMERVHAILEDFVKD